MPSDQINHTNGLVVVGDIHGARTKAQYLAHFFAGIHKTQPLAGILLVGDLADNVLPTKKRPTEGQMYMWKQGVLGVLRIFAEVGVPVLWVGGNHDMPNTQAHLLGETPANAINVDGRRETVGGWTVGGLGGSPDKFGWPYEWEEKDARRCLLEDVGDVDVLLTHTPALGCLDRTLRGEHVGSPAIMEQVSAHYFVVCGHIHEALGIEKVQHPLGVTMLGNAGAIGYPYPAMHYLLLKQGTDGCAYQKAIYSVNLGSGWVRGLEESKDGIVTPKTYILSGEEA
jgi:Icc-related predicted phosphoesterase